MLRSINNGINIIADEHTQRELNYYCPICNQAVILKRGYIKVAHFAHKIKSNCAGSGKETEWHLSGKKFIYDLAIEQGNKVELEVQLGNRRADALVITPAGIRIAYEFQRKDIINNMIERTNDLMQHVNKVIWVIPWSVNEKISSRCHYKISMSNLMCFNQGYQIQTWDGQMLIRGFPILVDNKPRFVVLAYWGKNRYEKFDIKNYIIHVNNEIFKDIKYYFMNGLNDNYIPITIHTYIPDPEDIVCHLLYNIPHLLKISKNSYLIDEALSGYDIRIK